MTMKPSPWVGDVRTRPLEISTEPGVCINALVTCGECVEAAFAFAHGAGAGMGHPFMEAVALGLAERRIACLRFQFPYMQAGRRRVDSAPLAHATVRAAVRMTHTLFPDVPLFAGGKSFGGRMTSQAQALEPLEHVEGLIFFGFPLHPAGKPAADRADHLSFIEVPMLFIRGQRDSLSEATQFEPMVSGLSDLAWSIGVADADHGLHVPKRSGRSDADVLDEVLDATVVWSMAWRLRAQSGEY
jgi:predicted alpha/beta-hydrolase family hydrolase